MIDRAHIEARLATLHEQREAHGRQLQELQQAVRATDRACAQIDGAILVLQEMLASDAAAPSTTNGAPEEEGHHVHGT